MSDPALMTRQVVAHNDAADSGNPMHDDAAARAMNFKAALVPGVTVFGYMTHGLVQRFGEAWLERGAMQVRFRRPVYAGDTLTIEAKEEADARVMQIEVRDPDAAVCVTGRGTLDGDPSTAAALLDRPIAAYRELPEPRWPATRQRFADEQVLGSVEARFAPEEAAAFLDAMQDDHPIYRQGVTHPAWLLRQANIVVDRNFDLGPWIHVESELRNFALARNGEPVQVRAQLIELFEKKGHEYADLDVVLLAAGDPGRPIMRVMHRAIYRMHADV